MDKLTKLLLKARKLAKDNSFLMMQLVPRSEGVELSGYITTNGREYTSINEFAASEAAALDRVREIQKNWNIADDDCVIISVYYGEGSG